MIKRNKTFIQTELGNSLGNGRHKKFKKDDETTSVYSTSVIGSNKHQDMNVSTKEAIIIDKIMKCVDNFQFKKTFNDLFDEIMDKSCSIMECQKVSLFIVHEEVQK